MVVVEYHFEALVERVLGLTPKTLYLLGVESIPLVVAGPAINKLNKVVGCTDCLENCFGNFNICFLVLSLLVPPRPGFVRRAIDAF